MTFTDDLWHGARHVREKIDQLPFVLALEAGTLSKERFAHYIEQDALYLGAYARALAAAAVQSSSPGHLIFWSERAASALQVERTLHEPFIGTASLREPSPTCTAYTSYLLSLVAGGSPATLVAGLLPCFWIYEDVGRRLKHRLGDLTGHPFKAWIDTYDDPMFAAVTDAARVIVDEVAALASPLERQRMRGAFSTASRYEWMFWDAAWRQETWPV